MADEKKGPSNAELLSQKSYKTISKMKPTEYQTFNPVFQKGETVDTSGLKSMIGSSAPSAMQPKTDATPAGAQTVSAAVMPSQQQGQTQGRSFSTGEFLNQLNGTKDRTFSNDRLSGAIEGAKTAGGTVAVNPAQYQNPEAVADLVSRMNLLMKPIADAQKASATTQANSANQRLQDQWASRGLLASGGAMAKQMEGSQALNQQMTNIDAQTLQQAIPLALQGAQLGLQEDAQKFSQNANNRDFAAQQAQNYVGNLLQGGNQEMAQDQQFLSQYLAGMGMEEQQIQNFIGNNMNLANMDIGQNQWAQNFGLQRQQNDFQRDLSTKQLNAQRESDWMSKLLGATGQATQATQFQQNFDQRQNEFNTGVNQWQQQFDRQGTQQDIANQQWQQQFDQGVKQNNIGNALQLSQLMGQLYSPMSGGAELFGQTPGALTGQMAQWQAGQMLNQANQYGALPQGTGSYLDQIMPGMGGFYGGLEGQQTLPGQQFDWNKQYQQGQLANQQAGNAISSRNADIRQAEHDLNEKFKNLSDVQKQATMGFAAEVLNAKDRDEAMYMIHQKRQDMAQQGVDPDTVAKYVDLKFPRPQNPKSSSSEASEDQLQFLNP